MLAYLTKHESICIKAKSQIYLYTSLLNIRNEHAKNWEKGAWMESTTFFGFVFGYVVCSAYLSGRRFLRNFVHVCNCYFNSSMCNWRLPRRISDISSKSIEFLREKGNHIINERYVMRKFNYFNHSIELLFLI